MANTAQGIQHPEHLIGGEWVSGAGAEFTSCNPARPSEIVASFHGGTRDDLASAVSVALSAQGDWETKGSIARGVILRNVADLMEDRREVLAALMTREQGKTFPESLGEIDGSVETIRYHAAKGRDSNGRTFPSSFPGEHIETVRQALGVVAVITPWNFPTQIPAWKIAPALLWGNTVVWKPAGDIPAISCAFAQVFHDAGVPAGVFNMVLAPGSVAQSLVDDPRIAGITFTGSVGVGKQIADSATSRGVKVQLELGGNNAAIVMPDADPEFAAVQLLVGAMSGSGQKCTATRRIITVGGIREPFIEYFTAAVKALVVGDGADSTTTTGPVISERSKAEIESAVADAVSDGGRIVAQASIPQGEGFYVAPTVIEGTMQVRTCKEEVFGPITTLLHAESLTQAIELANATEFGLTASIFSSNDADIAQATRELQAGLIKINAPNTGSELHVPFGGLKESTFPGPREQNAESASEFFTVTKSVYRRIAPRGGN
ncbi:MAG: aldehyde dehydrogenase family protein [Actinobacteria bacterium]|jgi:alpha-ketoglutaric semialdehyde dehydrogenase|nr:aldehyde dehydrogenase family protein [Actinomycetota bacterium]MBT5807586.1 aldehyde dehydrogenase family protein [Actinomycetota bacterium]